MVPTIEKAHLLTSVRTSGIEVKRPKEETTNGFLMLC